MPGRLKAKVKRMPTLSTDVPPYMMMAIEAHPQIQQQSDHLFCLYLVCCLFIYNPPAAAYEK